MRLIKIGYKDFDHAAGGERAAAGFPTQVLSEVGNIFGLRLRELSI